MNALVPVGSKAVASTLVQTGAVDEQFLTFVCAGNLYGVSILRVKEIIQFGEVTDVPMMPPQIRGVINLRGAVLPVIDLAVRFDRSSTKAGRRTCIVVLELENETRQRDIGMLVDSVSEVLEIPARDIEPAPPFGANVRTDFIRGMARLENRFVILLEVLKVFSIEELAALPLQGDAFAAGLAASANA